MSNKIMERNLSIIHASHKRLFELKSLKKDTRIYSYMFRPVMYNNMTDYVYSSKVHPPLCRRFKIG